MVLRAILPVALIAFLFNGSLRAETPKLPSTKAGVVIPLLEKFSPTGRSPAEEVKETKKILGDNCHCEIGGSDEDPLRQCYYFLDDGTQVEVVSSKKYFSICSVEKLGECDSTLTIKGIGQHLEGGFFEKIGGFAGQQG